MTQKEYLAYLQKLVGRESRKEWTTDNTQGVFQCFRPDGAGVEKVFEPFSETERRSFINRLLPLYAATNSPECAADMYFIPRQPKQRSAPEFVELGQQYLSRLKVVAPLMAFDADLVSVLERTEKVEWVERFSDELDDVLDIQIDEACGDALFEQIDFDSLIFCLRQAYISTANLKWLTNYLMWPVYEPRYGVDLYAPLFELWQSDCAHHFTGSALQIACRGRFA